MMTRLLSLLMCALLAACQSVQPISEPWQDLYHQATQAYHAGNYPNSVMLAKRAAMLASAQAGNASLAYAKAKNFEGAAYLALARYEEAEAAFRQAMPLILASPDTSSEDKSNVYNNLAEVYRQLDQIDQAVPLYKQALEVVELAHASDSLEVASATGALALAYHQQDDLTRAEPLYRRALAIHEAQGKQAPQLATLLMNMADLTSGQGRHEEAEALARRALAMDEREYGAIHPAVASDLNTLGTIYGAAKYNDQALVAYQRALRIRQASLGAEHPSTATTHSNIAVTLEALGRRDEAEQHYLEAIRILEMNFGPTHAGLRLNRRALADLYRKSTQHGKAEQVERLLVE